MSVEYPQAQHRADPVHVVAEALADWWDEHQKGCYDSVRPDGDDWSMAEKVVARLCAGNLLSSGSAKCQ